MKLTEQLRRANAEMFMAFEAMQHAEFTADREALYKIAGQKLAKSNELLAQIRAEGVKP